MTPKVSIILPTWKEAKYISRAIESVLTQTFTNWELVIIDDGLYDRVEDIIKEYIEKDERIIFIKNGENLGIQKSSNKALKIAKGEYIAKIDDDDEWISKDKLQKQVEFLDEKQEYVLVGTSVVIVNEEGQELIKYLLPITDKEIRKGLLLKNNFINSSVVFRKSVVVNLGGYDESEDAKHVEDYDLCIRLGIVGKLYNLPEYLTAYTLRRESISRDNRTKQFKRDIKLIKKYKNKYPGYFLFIILSYLRLVFYKIFELIPFRLLKYKILKIYKGL